MKNGVLLGLLVLARLGGAMTVHNLRCEYDMDPIGIATLQPRLSWTLSDSARNQMQTAYQIRVASTPKALSEGEPLLWDSDKTVSSETVHIMYDGTPLRDGMRCFWQVRAWDRDGKATDWSAPAQWQVALTDPASWQAKWIGPSASHVPAWGDLTLTADLVVDAEAVGLVFRAPDAANGYMWQINRALGAEPLLRPHVQQNGSWKMLPAVSLGAFMADGDQPKPHRIEIEARGTVIRTRIDGKLADERTDSTFASGTVGFRTSDKERARVNALTVVDAAGATLIVDTFDRASPAFPKLKVEDGHLLVSGGMHLYTGPLPKACPRLRKTFAVAKPVARATASVCGLGFYELYLNGRKAGDRVLSPPNTPYASRILFDTLDVTPLIQAGDNAVGIWLAPGYSDDYSQWGWKWELAKRAILQLDIDHPDGSRTTVVTDPSWQAGPSPLTFASLYDGEIYDAALETPAWTSAAFKAEGWKPVTLFEPTAAAFKPNTMPPVRVIQTLRPVAVRDPKPGVYVFDLGQNIAGWARLRANGPRGTRITLRHSELTDRDGMIDPWTNRRAKATDTFVLAGSGSTESYEPRFTYHGFRFIEVTGYPGVPTCDDVTGCVVHADAAPAGSFLCSDATLNQIYSNCLWSMRGNFMSIPTDCTMRDERTPCQMDSLAYEDTALFTFWMNSYYTKWLDDIAGGRGNPDWNGDTVFLPWRLYLHTGDRRILTTHYANMRAYIDALHARTPDHIYTQGFGDWCPPNDGSWQGYHGDVTDVNTCLYAALARIVAEASAVLGHTAEHDTYTRLSEQIARAYHAKRYRAETATYGDGSQTTAILPLALNVAPHDARDALARRLVATIRDTNKGRLDTGIFGTRYLLDVLCDIGEADLGLDMLTQPEYPGFGFQVANGATTLWEQWSVKGGMNSHNHAMFAGVGAAFFTRLAGITALRPGFEEIGIRPVMPKRLAFVKAGVETVKGQVAVHWRRVSDGLAVEVTVPVNATARIALPAPDAKAVTTQGTRFVGMENDRAVYVAGSGTFEFRIR